MRSQSGASIHASPCTLLSVPMVRTLQVWFGVFPLRMDHCVGSLCLDHKYCSAAPSFPEHACRSVIAHSDPPCGCTSHPPCVPHRHMIHGRCSWTDHLPRYTSVTCNTLSLSSTPPCLTSIIRREAVLARRDPDGFYYLGTVRHQEEPGVFLIEFNEPSVQRDRYPAMLQKTRSGDIIQYEEARRRCIVPGDNVLAPWEPGLTRYGPGTVILGLETRDPLRVTEDEDLTVCFWNGKKVSVALGVALWISPTVHHRIVDALHRPITGRQLPEAGPQSTTTYVITDRCTTVPVPVCATDHRHGWGHHPVHPHLTHQHCTCCCFPRHPTCTCCSDPKCRDWWPLTPRTAVYVQRGKETDNHEELYSSTAARTTSRNNRVRHWSSSSESEGEDEDTDGETYLSRTTRSTMVDSAVNTDSSLWDEPRSDAGDRPEWKYWKRGQPEPFYRKPGIIKSNSRKSPENSGAGASDGFGATNRSALFETISDSPARRLTVKDVLVHADFVPSHAEPSRPVAERLGETEIRKLRLQHAILEKQQEQKERRRQREQKREDESEKKYNQNHETQRKKSELRLQNEEQKVKERETRNITNMKAKMAASEERKERNRTVAAEDKKREQRRLEHLRNVREKIDRREYEKCAASEQNEIKHLAAQQRRTENHYREVAGKVFQSERGGGRRVLDPET
ncbi:PREDICTED: uncharacterized protein C11orf16 homolog [Nanorana parkeri]|uniref:uncharacterized protein C11orf16 homolog n=1 Tax=Nanorana parkeri TaxID=125878 RepID=UPI0008543DD7|nr:PREDICTED: uncharacterized protein C11orf16 homolog [Nanorana parkeri]